MKPNILHVKLLEQYDAEKFASWLRRGFEDVYHREKQVTAFYPLNYFVRRRDDLASDLKVIYEALSGSAREQFRMGNAIALSKLPPNYESVKIVRELLHLAGRIHATEILPEAIKQIGNGFFGMPDYNEGRELFALTLDIVAGMSPAHGVADEVRQLVASSFFQPDYAPRAFIALCRTEPEEFPEHLALLRKHFSRLQTDKGTDEAYITASRFAQYVDTKVIADNFSKMQLSANPEVAPVETDNWLGKALFLGVRAPLRLDIQRKSDEYVYVITRHKQDQADMIWEINLSYNDTDLEHVYNVTRFLDQCLAADSPRLWQELKDRKNLNAAMISKLKNDSPLYPPKKRRVIRERVQQTNL